MRMTGVHHGNKHFQFRCNICGDSDSNKSKKRGHLKLSESRSGNDPFWTFKCFNVGDCPAAGEGNAWPARNWLKVSFPFLYKDYQREILSNSSPEDIAKIEAKNDEYEKELEERRKKHLEEKHKQEMKDIKCFKPILKAKDNSIVERAIEFCKSRRIPEEIWHKFFISDGGETFKNRLIIPFYDSYDKIYYWQARTLFKGGTKYLNRTFGKDNAVYNIHRVNKNKPVIAVEGPIDSMFIENAIAICGLELSDEIKKLMNKMDVYYLFDNDGPGRQKAEEYLKQGKNVFLWRRFRYFDKYQEKQDINQIYIDHNLKKPFTFDELKDCFSNSLYDIPFI